MSDRIAVFKRTGLLNAHAVKETQMKAEKVYKALATEKDKLLSVEGWSYKNRQIAFNAAENKSNFDQVKISLTATVYK